MLSGCAVAGAGGAAAPCPQPYWEGKWGCGGGVTDECPNVISINEERTPVNDTRRRAY